MTAAAPTAGTSQARGNDTVMWEVTAAPDRIVDLVAWVTDTLVPRLDDEPACHDVAIYEARQDDAARLVVIAEFAGEPAVLPDPPDHLVARAPHQWPFRRLR